MAMDIKTLEEEYSGLSSDKAGLTEYLQTLWEQVEKLKVHELSFRDMEMILV